MWQGSSLPVRAGAFQDKKTPLERTNTILNIFSQMNHRHVTLRTGGFLVQNTTRNETN
jgi:hypothetical protein